MKFQFKKAMVVNYYDREEGKDFSSYRVGEPIFIDEEKLETLIDCIKKRGYVYASGLKTIVDPFCGEFEGCSAPRFTKTIGSGDETKYVYIYYCFEFDDSVQTLTEEEWDEWLTGPIPRKPYQEEWEDYLIL